MKAEIISIGTELLLGQIVNSDAQYLSTELARIGIDVYYHSVVGDNSKRLLEAIEIAKRRSDLIVFTGGLGPTKDDLTKETVASALSLKLVFNEDAFKKIVDYYAKINRKMTDNSKRQAIVIEGSTILPNEKGMAPGMAVTIENCTYMLLPGPPSELIPMFEKFGRPFLIGRLETKEFIESRILRFFGIGESQLETEIEDLIDSQQNPTIAPLASHGEVTLRLTAKSSSLANAERMLDTLEGHIQQRVGEFFYGYNHTSLYETVFLVLRNKGLTISSAESLTGGAFAKELTSFDGASSVFNGSIVCYQNEVKREFLHVSDSLIGEFGVVSQECAKQMAEQIRKSMNTDIGISFTGVAGPTEQEGKRVGTVYIGIAFKDLETDVFSLALAGDRSAIRNRAVKYGYFYLLKNLSK